MRMLAGDPALDFANSLHWRSGREVDFLPHYACLLDWCVPAGLLSEGERDRLHQVAQDNPVAASAAHMEAIRLRGIWRACLSERGFIYSSPLSVFNDPDAFIDDISRLGCILEKLQIRRTFADGAEACVMMNIKVRMAELSSIDVAIWASVQGGRIVAMEAFFDGRKYDDLFE